VKSVSQSKFDDYSIYDCYLIYNKSYVIHTLWLCFLKVQNLMIGG